MTSRCVYRRILGEAFDLLPEEIRRFHALAGSHRLRGRVTVQGPDTAVARVLLRLLRFPVDAATDAPLAFDLCAGADEETWKRSFPGGTLRSRLSTRAGFLIESIGPARFWFVLLADGERLALELRKVTVLGVALPRRLAPTLDAVERAAPGRLCFDVVARFPGNRRLLAYRGFLDLVAEPRTGG